jgi:YVTN family beta-propeller protein
LNITAVGNVCVIDIGTNAVAATVGVGENPTGVAVGSISGTCSGDCNNNDVETVDELLAAANTALNGCAGAYPPFAKFPAIRAGVSFPRPCAML